MNFNDHSNLIGQHAFLSASKPHWTNYDEEKLSQVYLNSMAAAKGTELHEYAKMAIKNGIKQARSPKTLNMYINDAIGYQMTPEQPLVYSMNAFGTADTISFRKDFLRIHDFKSGVTPSSMTQLKVYVALFCLEYRVRPGAIGIETRIYQNDEVIVDEPELDDIAHIMDKIIRFDKRIEQLKGEVT